jgi:hypothetical protein
MAKAAAPFVHPRLTATKVSGDKDLFGLSALSDNELALRDQPSRSKKPRGRPLWAAQSRHSSNG